MLYLAQNCKPKNYVRLSEGMKYLAEGDGYVNVEQFTECLKQANMSATGKEVEAVVGELTNS